MKTFLPILLVGALVFGATLISHFSTAPKPKADEGGQAGSELPPLVVGMSEVYYDPESEIAMNRFYPGFYEVGSENNSVGFFARNYRPEPVLMAALAPSCSKCTSARGTVIPSDDMQSQIAHSAIGSLWSPIPIPDLLTAAAWSATQSKLQWHQFEFNSTKTMLGIPAAASPTTPTWALIELAFKIAAIGEPSAVGAFFDVYNEAGVKQQPRPMSFSVRFAGREAFEVYPNSVEVGDFPEGGATHNFDLLAYSVVYDGLRLKAPIMSVPSDDPFLKVSLPSEITGQELKELSLVMSNRLRYPVRVQVAYKYTLTVSREANGKSMDVGRFDKTIYCAGTQGTREKTYQIPVRGTVLGSVRLEQGSKIDFGTYNATYLTKKTERIYTDVSELDVELVPELCEPKFVKVSIEQNPTVSGRKYWTLTLQIPEQEGRRPPWNGEVVLKTKGANPVRVRIPVSGHGR